MDEHSYQKYLTDADNDTNCAYCEKRLPENIEYSEEEDFLWNGFCSQECNNSYEIESNEPISFENFNPIQNKY